MTVKRVDARLIALAMARDELVPRDHYASDLMDALERLGKLQ